MLQIIIIVIAIAADQISKIAVVDWLQVPGTTSVLIEDVLSFTYVQNTGAAFGLMSGAVWLFVPVTALMCAALLGYMYKKKDLHWLAKVSLSLIVAGGIGNLIDRLALGYVRDFIEFTFVRFYTFNVADICVTCGAFVLIVILIRSEIKSWRESKQSCDQEEDPQGEDTTKTSKPHYRELNDAENAYHENA
jgi:signal peptidase II